MLDSHKVLVGVLYVFCLNLWINHVVTSQHDLRPRWKRAEKTSGNHPKSWLFRFVEDSIDRETCFLYKGYLVGGWATPLKTIHQLGWLDTQYMEKCQKCSTNHQPVYLLVGCWWAKNMVFFVLWVHPIPEDVPIRKTEKLGNFGKNLVDSPLNFPGKLAMWFAPMK